MLSTNVVVTHKYIRQPDTRTDMYAGCVACCALASPIEYAPRALLRVEKKTPRALSTLKKTGQTD